MASMFSKERLSHGRAGDGDLIIIGIAVTALLTLAAFGNYYFETLRGQLVRLGADNSGIVVGLLLLNVALTIYGWRRYHDVKREILERTAAEGRARTLASTDPLTGFLNRRALGCALETLIMAAARKKQAVAMMIIDLDGFKTINDVHGHLTGDNLLRTTADVIQKALPANAAKSTTTPRCTT